MKVSENISFVSYCDEIKICVYGKDDGLVADMTPKEALVLSALLQEAALRIIKDFQEEALK